MSYSNEKLEPELKSEAVDSLNEISNQAAPILAPEDSTALSNENDEPTSPVVNSMLSISTTRPALIHWITPTLVGYGACAIPCIVSLVRRTLQHLFFTGSINLGPFQNYVLINVSSSFHISVSNLIRGPFLALLLINLWSWRSRESRSKLFELAAVMAILFLSTALQWFYGVNWNPQAFGWAWFLRRIMQDYATVALPAAFALAARELLIFKASNLRRIKSPPVDRLETLNKNS